MNAWRTVPEAPTLSSLVFLSEIVKIVSAAISVEIVVKAALNSSPEFTPFTLWGRIHLRFRTMIGLDGREFPKGPVSAAIIVCLSALRGSLSVA